jgi:predicted transcriptional regulator
MRRSKLESYEDVLQALVNKPLTFEHLMQAANIDDALLKRCLDFLKKNSLVEERTVGKKTLYAITERGIAVLRALNFQKYLAKIKNTIRAIDEAIQVIPDITQSNHQFTERIDD